MSAAIEAAQIAQARKAAAATRRRVVDVLEESAGGDPDGFTARLAATLRLDYLSMSQLRGASPAFDLLPFNECSQRGCALLRGGVPLVSALEMAGELLPAVLAARLDAARRAIAEGHGVSQSMDANGLTTPVALRMLAVGERSGNMGEMLESIAVFHDEELSRWVEWFTRLFEPVLMAIIGLVIGVIVILMYMPIFELAGAVQ